MHARGLLGDEQGRLRSSCWWRRWRGGRGPRVREVSAGSAVPRCSPTPGGVPGCGWRAGRALLESCAPMSWAALQHSTRSSRPSSRPPWASSSWPGPGGARGRRGRRTAPPARPPPGTADGRLAGEPGGVGLGERELDPVVRRAPLVGEPAVPAPADAWPGLRSASACGVGRRPATQGLEADPRSGGGEQRGVTVVELGQVRPRRLEARGRVVTELRDPELRQDLRVVRHPAAARSSRCAPSRAPRGAAVSTSPRARASSARGAPPAGLRPVRAPRALEPLFRLVEAAPPHESDHAAPPRTCAAGTASPAKPFSKTRRATDTPRST